MTSVREDDLLDLVDRIYEAGMSFDRWPQALTRMADVLGARDAALGAMAPTGLPWIFAPRTDPAFMQTYAEAYHPLNEVWHAVTQRGVGRPATDDMVMPRDRREKSAFHNEWFRPQGYSTSMGGMILHEHGWRTVLMLPGRSAFGRDQLRLMHMLTPHLRRAVQLNIKLAQGDLDTDVTARLLEEMQAAAFVVDADARVLFANAAADRLFQAGRGIRLVQGVLTAVRTEDADTLAAVIAGCAAGGLQGHGGVVEAPHASGTPTRLQFLPARRGTPLLASTLPAAIVFDESHRAPADPALRLRLMYGLTPAEAAFALEIVKGDGKPLAAERLGISFATARTHLSHIFAKTGVRRQAELVRLVLGDEGPT